MKLYWNELKHNTGMRQYTAAVIVTKNEGGCETQNGITICLGVLRVGADRPYCSFDGSINLGKIMVATIEAFYKTQRHTAASAA